MLQVFKPFPTVRQTCRAAALPDATRAFARDTITLGWVERLKVRARRRSDGGVEFGTVLDRGTMLREGDCLILDEPPTVITVVAQQEAVFVIAPRTAADWGRFAYQIGNSHQPLMLTDTAIVCPDVLGMEQVLTYHGIPFSRASCAFTPIGHAGEIAEHRHQP